MIFNEDIQPRQDDSLAEFLERELFGFVPELEDKIQDVVAVVTAFIQQRHINRCLTADYLLLLLARALWAIGEETAAQRYIEARGSEWRVAPVFKNVFQAYDLSLPHWSVFLCSRAVQTPLAYPWRSMWTFDMRRLVEGDDCCLELCLFRSLDLVLEQLSGVWDAVRGRGLLGLKNLETTTATLLACRTEQHKSMALAGEIMEYIHRRLLVAQAQRGWETVPDIISLQSVSRAGSRKKA